MNTKTIALKEKYCDGKRVLVARDFAKENIELVFTTSDDNFRRGETHCSDETIAVKLQNLQAVFGARRFPVVCTNQVHGVEIGVVSQRPVEIFNRLGSGDGLVTRRHDVFLAMTFADCVPIVLYDEQNCVLAAVHSGWRGTVLHIVKEAVAKMCANGAVPEKIKVLLGPHIDAQSFEVGAEVKQQFETEWPNLVGLVVTKADKSYIDMEMAIEADLMAMQVKSENIYTVAQDTVTNSDLFHSFRRDGDTYSLMACAVRLCDAN